MARDRGGGVKFRTPDGAVLAYLNAHDRAAAPKTPSMGQSGREYAHRCGNAKCGKLKRTTVVGRKGELVERCAAYGDLWPWVEAYILAGQSHAGKGGSAPATLERAGDLAAVIGALETAPIGVGYADLYLAWLAIGSKSIQAIADDADAIGAHGQRWTKSKVETAIRTCRRWLERELDRRGMLVPRVELGAEKGVRNA